MKVSIAFRHSSHLTHNPVHEKSAGLWSVSIAFRHSSHLTHITSDEDFLNAYAKVSIAFRHSSHLTHADRQKAASCAFRVSIAFRHSSHLTPTILVGWRDSLF